MMHEVHTTSSSSTRTHTLYPMPFISCGTLQLAECFQGPSLSHRLGFIPVSEVKCPLQRPRIQKRGVGVQSLSHRVTRNIKDQMESIVKIFKEKTAI